MGKRLRHIKKIKKQIRLHHEGTHMLLSGFFTLLVLNGLFYWLDSTHVYHTTFAVLTTIPYLVAVNFFRCPIRKFGEPTEDVVVAPADGKVVVVEEVEENEYFHDKRIMVSIFMSLFNVHANWIPADGTVKMVRHHNGNFHKAWLPKASEENERATTVIEMTNGTEILVRQVAGAVARRIVTYAHEEDNCFVDEHLGFIKFGSRVDLYLPLGTPINVVLGQRTTGNETVIAKVVGTKKETTEKV